ncbi:Uncharacterised protein [Brucella anthropi]|nr:hypothetical protein F9K90_23855 [Brucella anthropi]SUB55844.1 Uncharacterised protein [Brucella anthropi]
MLKSLNSNYRTVFDIVNIVAGLGLLISPWGVVTLSFSGRKDQGLVDIHAKQAAIFHASKASRRW